MTMSPKLRGPWNAAEVAAYLDGARIPVRLACTRGADGPLIVSLWFEHRDGALWCATQNSSRTAKYLAQDDRCAFEIAGETLPYSGVRGQGRATLSEAEGPRVLARLIERYLGAEDSSFTRWLRSRAETEVAIRIDPTWITSWDFSERMKTGA